MENKLWIGGKWVTPKSGKVFPTFNPTTGEELEQVPLAGQAEIDIAVEAARKAYPAWSRKTQAERSQVLNRIAAGLKEKGEEIARVEILEHGTTVELAHHIPMIAAEHFDWAASTAKTLMEHVVPAFPNVMTYLKREPVGVCAIITPWNHALLMMAVKLAQALAVGNTCVLKPPSVNSLMGIKFAQILDGLELPPGLVNVVTGPGGTVGHALASHPGVDMVGFTGSSDTGKAIMAAGSQTIKRLTMELGGKNPVIVLDDADVESAVKFLAPRQCDNAGQHCSGAGRYYVHQKIYEEFVEKFVAESKKIVVGDPADKNTFMGPLTSREHRDRVEAHIKVGVEEGARLVLGGKRPAKPPLDRGFFVMPTVFTHVAQDMRIAREEIFGPVAVIMKPFTSEEEVIELANDNHYGLCATVFTEDGVRGMRFVELLHAGTVSINTQVIAPDLPWGGFKESGIGKEGGLIGLKDYTQVKLVCLKLK
jgi:acyl-CoA reductase-like NAD-dependent aldehyde dehydrogenase